MAKRRPRGRPAGNPAARQEAPEVATVAAVVPSPMPDDLIRDLRGYAADRRELEALISETVGAARARGATWTALGRALGVSPQAVQKRYRS